jgi:hypothetical protein
MGRGNIDRPDQDRRRRAQDGQADEGDDEPPCIRATGRTIRLRSSAGRSVRGSFGSHFPQSRDKGSSITSDAPGTARIANRLASRFLPLHIFPITRMQFALPMGEPPSDALGRLMPSAAPALQTPRRKPRTFKAANRRVPHRDVRCATASEIICASIRWRSPDRRGRICRLWQPCSGARARSVVDVAEARVSPTQCQEA